MSAEALAPESDPLDELLRENGVAEQLVQRLVALASALRSGVAVPGSRLAEGLSLLERYWMLHGRRFDRDFQPQARPFARPVPMARCTDHLDRIEEERPHDLSEASALLDGLSRSSDAAPVRRDEVGRRLIHLAERLRDAIRYETEYPLSCLLSALPEEVEERVTQSFTTTDRELTELEAQVSHYLDSTAEGGASESWSGACVHPHCGTTAPLTLQKRDAAGLFLTLPPGWQVASPPSASTEPLLRELRFGVCCPGHAAERARAALDSGAIARWADDGGAPGPVARAVDLSEEGDCGDRLAEADSPRPLLAGRSP